MTFKDMRGVTFKGNSLFFGKNAPATPEHDGMEMWPGHSGAPSSSAESGGS